MIKKNWSIVAIFLLVLSFILLSNILRVVPVDTRVQPEEKRLPDRVFRDMKAPAGRLPVRETVIRLMEGEVLGNYRIYDGVLFFTMGKDHVQQSDAMEYSLYSYFSQAEKLYSIGSNLPFRMEIVGAGERNLLLLETYSDRTVVLEMYSRHNKSGKTLMSWKNLEEEPYIRYAGGLTTIKLGETWTVLNSSGREVSLEFNLPEGAKIVTMGASGDHVVVYYEVDSLRYIALKSISSARTRSFLIPERVREFHMLQDGFLAELESEKQNVFHFYRFHDLSNERWILDKKVQRVHIIDESRIAFIFQDKQFHYLIYDRATKRILVRESSPLNYERWQNGGINNSIFYYLHPIRQFNRVLFY